MKSKFLGSYGREDDDSDEVEDANYEIFEMTDHDNDHLTMKSKPVKSRQQRKDESIYGDFMDVRPLTANLISL